MMMKGRSNSNASNASNSSYGNSFDQSPLSPPPALNDVPLYKPQSSAAAPKQQPQQQPTRPVIAPKPKTAKAVTTPTKNSISNESVEANKVDTGANSAADTQQGVDNESKPPEPLLPSYNDIMKDVDDTVVEDETTLEEDGAAGTVAPLPSYNDIMKDIENKSPSPTMNQENAQTEG